MSDDERPQAPTQKIPPISDRALLEDVTRTARSIANEVSQLREEVVEVATQGRSMERRLLRVEEKVDELDGRMLRNSSRVQGTSQNDLKQDAAISNIITTQEEHGKAIEKVSTALAENTVVTNEIKNVVTSALKHPAVIALGLAIVTFLTAWLGKQMP